MLTKKTLPNLLKTTLFVTAATFSISAFAGHHEEAVEVAEGEMSDMKSEASEMVEGATEDTMADKMGEMSEMKSEAEGAMAEVEDAKEMVEDAAEMVEGADEMIKEEVMEEAKEMITE